MYQISTEMGRPKNKAEVNNRQSVSEGKQQQEQDDRQREAKQL